MVQRTIEQRRKGEESGTHKIRKEWDEFNGPGQQIQCNVEQTPLLDHGAGAVAVKIIVSGAVVDAHGKIGDGKAKAEDGGENGEEEKALVLQDVLGQGLPVSFPGQGNHLVILKWVISYHNMADGKKQWEVSADSLL